MLVTYLMMLDSGRDRVRFLWLYHRLRHRMYRAALRLLHDEDRAQDAVQEALKKIILHFSKISALPSEEMDAYVVIIVVNTAKDMLRGDGRQAPLDEAWDQPAAGDAETAGDYRRLVELIQAMPEPYRDVLVLKFVEEETNRAIAARLGLTESQVANRIFRGRALLVQRLKEEGYGP